MRISDWSSDVCSSDLDFGIDRLDRLQDSLAEIARLVAVAHLDRFMRARGRARGHRRAAEAAVFQQDIDRDRRISSTVEKIRRTRRSEEHTSALQSLMRS